MLIIIFILEQDDWKGKWFPGNPNEVSTSSSSTTTPSSIKPWTGKW
jgi:hypothetical protein